MVHTGNNKPAAIDYKTHLLVGIRASGEMKVIYQWSHVPKQADVQRRIDALEEVYVTFALCTPTSIMPAQDDPHKKSMAAKARGR
jgi:hypothetical protein